MLKEGLEIKQYSKEWGIWAGKDDPGGLHIFNRSLLLTGGHFKSCWWITVLLNFLENLKTILLIEVRVGERWDGLFLIKVPWQEFNCDGKYVPFLPLLTIEWYLELRGSLKCITPIPNLSSSQELREDSDKNQGLLWGRWEREGNYEPWLELCLLNFSVWQQNHPTRRLDRSTVMLVKSLCFSEFSFSVCKMRELDVSERKNWLPC